MFGERGEYRHFKNRKHFLSFYQGKETKVEVCGNKKCCGNTNQRRVFRTTAFLSSLKLSQVFVWLDKNTEKMYPISFLKVTL